MIKTEKNKSVIYILKKARYAHSLYKKGLPFKKVYAVVEKNGKYVVLENLNPKHFKYALSGGGVDKGEDNNTAIKREVLEELNINIEITKSLGIIEYVRTWKYKNKVFPVNYLTEIYLTKFISYGNNTQFGLSGEFSDNKTIAEITKKEMLENVECFVNFGIKLED